MKAATGLSLGWLTAYCLGLLVHVQHRACIEVDTSWMREALTNHLYRTRHHAFDPAVKNETMMFIHGYFSNLGLDTRIQTFDTEQEEVKGHNVIGILRGRQFGTRHDFPIGVVAHYDTVRSSSGVDDNGSGVAALMQTASARKRMGTKLEYTVIFIASDFEEWEYYFEDVACGSIACGSREFVTRWLPEFWKRNYHRDAVVLNIHQQFQGFVILDAVMNINLTANSQSVPEQFQAAFPSVMKNLEARHLRGDFLAIVGRGEEKCILDVIQKEWNHSAKNSEYHIERFDLPSISTAPLTDNDIWSYYKNFGRSDHIRYWLGGHPAIFLTDTANFRGSMRTCYHQMCDGASFVTDDNLNFLAQTTMAVINTIIKLCETPCISQSPEYAFDIQDGSSTSPSHAKMSINVTNSAGLGAEKLNMPHMHHLLGAVLISVAVLAI